MEGYELAAKRERLSIAVSAALLALDEAEKMRQEHLVGTGSKKMVIFRVDHLRELLEAGEQELRRRGVSMLKMESFKLITENMVLDPRWFSDLSWAERVADLPKVWEGVKELDARILRAKQFLAEHHKRISIHARREEEALGQFLEETKKCCSFTPEGKRMVGPGEVGIIRDRLRLTLDAIFKYTPDEEEEGRGI